MRAWPLIAILAVVTVSCGRQDGVEIPPPERAPTGSLLVLQARPCNFIRQPDPNGCDDVGLARIGLDGTVIETLEVAPPMALRSMAMSHDRMTIAWTWNWEVGVMDLDDGESRTVTRKLLPEHLAERAVDPVFSPDGTELLYHWSGANNESAWYRVDLRTLERAEMPMPVDCQAPAWSPVGHRVACEVWSPTAGDPGRSAAEIYLVDLETLEARLLTDAADAMGAYRPDWSPDGRWLTFSMSSHVPEEMEAVGGIWVVDVEAREGRRIIEGTVFTPTWSPDGGHVAAYDEERGRIVIVGRDGSGLTSVDHERSEYLAPRWVP